jgi:octopine/nopaline transport system substrate-binding protein
VKNLKSIIVGLMMSALSTVAFADGHWSTIKIGTEGAYEPWNFTDSDGNLVGAELDLARDLCARMNAECEFVQQDWDGIIPALVNGKYDVIMAGMSVTEERKKTISFSKAYMTEPARFFSLNSSPLSTFSSAKNLNLDDDGDATAGTISALNNAMKGMNVGVTVATIHEDFANKYLDSNLKVYPTQDEMNLDLAAGRIDAMLCDVGTAEAFMETAGGSDVVTFGPNVFGGLLGEGVGAGIRQGDADLKAMFDKAIADAAADGTISKISMQWFGKDLAP